MAPRLIVSNGLISTHDAISGSPIYSPFAVRNGSTKTTHDKSHLEMTHDAEKLAF